MKTNKKSVKLCETCGGENTKTHLTMFPIKIGEKNKCWTSIGQGVHGLSCYDAY
jgi:hypothetical protein